MALSDTYKTILDKAIEAVHTRKFFAQYPEHPKAYGEEAPARGKAAFENQLNKRFESLMQDNPEGWIGSEISPYTQEPLGITYPAFSVATLIERSRAAFDAWRKTPVDSRAAILIDSLERIKDRFYEIAYATQHTTGQSFIMSFQASGPHANDRALEALALGYKELQRFPQKVRWEKPMGKFDIRLEKIYHAVPKGIGLVIGCSTFPVWNSVPGIYASLITGNPVIVKPHPGAVLPIAIVVSEIQNTLKAAGANPLTIQLAVDSPERLITKELAAHPDVRLIDYTGSSAFGNYIESLPGKTVFTEKAGVNSVIFDSVDDIDAVMQNLAFSVALYSGQMCTAPQNFFIPAGGVKTKDGQLSYEEVVDRLKNAINGLVNHPKMGAGTLGAIQNPATVERVKQAMASGAKVLLEPADVTNEEFKNARVCSPVLLEVNASDVHLYEQELFGPIAVVVKTSCTEESVKIARQMAEKHGAITCALYCTDDEKSNAIIDQLETAFVPVSVNFRGFIWVNQHAAFSDFHVTGGNPAGNASFTNPDFINRRFVWVGHRKYIE